MCGIAGGWNIAGWPARDNAMAASMRRIGHRGPDDSGTEAWNPAGSGCLLLGSTRLAILDLSAAGHMPMNSADSRFTVVFNGEITNYLELRDELERRGETFLTRSDTEVLLHAWAIWGERCLNRFEGMFAFAILDKQHRRLTLARDVFGIKPLYYAHSLQDEFIFCSELPGLLELLPTAPMLDWQTAIDYLQFGAYDGTEHTFIKGVNQLMPGHIVTLDLTSGELVPPRRYWWPTVESAGDPSLDDSAQQVREMFLQSVRRNLRSDVPIGVALSGGIDSSAIACAVRYLEPNYPLSTFSFIAPGFGKSEQPWIDCVVKATGATSHTVSATGLELLRDLDDMILSQGEPFGSTSIYAQYRVFKLARENNVIVTLDGQGADEMFAGYDGYPAQRLRSLIERGNLLEARRFLAAWSQWPNRASQAAALRTVAQFVPASVARAVERVRTVKNPLIDYAALRSHGVQSSFPRFIVQGVRSRRLPSYLRTQITRRGLPSLLRHGDRNSMAFSVESRVPFLDRGLVEYVLTLPEEHLVGRDGTSKNVLRRAMRGIVPEEILDRRDKIGFETPEGAWLSDFKHVISTDGRARIGFLHATADTVVAQGSLGDDLGFARGGLWRYLNLKRWVEVLGVNAE